jgi:peptide/nickel transport system permease protein
MTISWLFRRLLLLFAIVITAATLNFILPQLSPNNPLEAKMLELAETGGSAGDISGLVESYQEKFGLNEPLYVQYFHYVTGLLTFDLGYSIAFYPAEVGDLIAGALPWTIGLLFVTTLIAFGIGITLGSLVAWERAPGFVKMLAPALMMLSALPYYLFGLILIYFFAFVWKVFPLQGGYSLISIPGWSWSFVADVLYHSILPALSIILTSIGTWMLSARGMMIIVRGEDYMVYSEANGLKPRRRFLNFAMRNTLLPQVTALALQLGHIAAGAVLVERVFGYPGIGMLLFQAIEQSDYFLIYGIVYIIILMIAVMMFILDLVYPLLDPRIRNE